MSDLPDQQPLDTSEAVDSDMIRNDDGDAVVDPPERWIPVGEDEDLDERLSAEVPDVTPEDVNLADADEPDAAELVFTGDDQLDRLDAAEPGREKGQIDGTPEDGSSFFQVAE